MCLVKDINMQQRVVLLYDSSIEDSLTRVAMQAGFQATSVEELQSVLEHISIADARWQCLSAVDPTGKSLPQLLGGLRDIPIYMRPYVIVVSDKHTASVDLPDDVDATITLPIDIHDLYLLLRPARRFIQLQTEFRKQALRDPLTGILNRRAVLDMLERELLRGRRLGYAISVAMVDIDCYKQINDSLGHLAGDAAMTAFATRLESQLRPYDAVGRYGGDEFLIVLTDCGLQQALQICDRIRSAVSSAPFTATGHLVEMSISIGLACVESASNTSVHEVIHRADTALYQAKNSGRNRVVVAS